MKKTHVSIAIFFLFGISLSSAQGWEKTFPGQAIDRTAVQFKDHYLVQGLSSPWLGPSIGYSWFTQSLTAHGEHEWFNFNTPFTDSLFEGLSVENKMAVSQDFLYYVDRREFEIDGQLINNEIVRKVDEDYNEVWEYIPELMNDDYFHISEIWSISDGGVVGIIYNSGQKYGFRLNAAGELQNIAVLNEQIYDYKIRHFVSETGSDVFYSWKANLDGSIMMQDLDQDLNLINSQTFQTVDYNAYPFPLGNGEFVFFEYNQFETWFTQARYGSAQELISLDTIYSGEQFDLFNIIQLTDGFLLFGTSPGLNELNHMTALRTDLEGNVQWFKRYDHHPGGSVAYNAIQTNDGGFLLVGKTGPLSSALNRGLVVKTNAEGEIYSNVISGNVAIDHQGDCVVGPGDTGVSGWIITATKGEDVFVANSDSLGNYILPIDTGTYVIALTMPNNYWASCTNETEITFTDFENSAMIDFQLTSVIDCPIMTINSQALVLRSCFDRPGYINYCNNGTTTAEGAYIEMSYDPLIQLVSATIPYVDLGDNVYRFELGDIAPLACGDFQTSMQLDCGAETGLSYCIEAKIFPDTICGIDPAWNGAFIEVKGSCETDDVYFQISNTGDAGMDVPSDYIIVEDAILLLLDSVELESGGNLDIPYPANGATYTLVAEQVAGAPGHSFPIAIVEGCGENGNGGVSTGFSNQFPQNDGNPFVDIDCPIAVNSFDPNDKLAEPEGYGVEHYIEPGTAIEYTIRFQNTGTDTAYNVLIRDTLDVNFDLGSLVPGVASHDYTWEMNDRGVLIFRFSDIMLPDSNVNVLASNGFVNFKISPRETTPLTTKIYNDAAIYFDYNEPVITNETWHTIDVDFIEVIVGTTSHPELDKIQVLVYPNPFTQETNLQIKNHQAENYLLEIYSVDGKLLRQKKHRSFEIPLRRGNLSSGIYFYKLTAADGFQNIGKIVVQ